VRRLLAEIERPDIEIVRYGLASESLHLDFAAVDLRPNQLGGTDFVLLREGDTLGLVRLRVPGAHNVRNALAAIAVCQQLGVPLGDLYRALASFGGVGRRFQVIGEVGDVTVIDDYAHHPTEIRATLSAARQRYPGRRLWAVWQPHTYSRTRSMLSDFATSFADADRVVVLDIYRSRERDTLGIDSAQVAAQMEHEETHYAGGNETAAHYILNRIRPGDVLLTLGAGDGDEVGQQVFQALRKRISKRRG
jgi:UDP-N-acetylmuramate--alanine ligase